MRIFGRITGRRVEKRGLMIFFCLILLSVFMQAAALAQQPAPPKFEATGLDKPAQDITLTGTVDQLNSTRTPGAPTGFLLTVNGPQGVFTANLGFKLSPKLQQSLAMGPSVRVTGVMETIGVKSYLLARTITVDGKQITLRNEHGFAVYSPAHSRASVSNADLSEGAK